MPASCDLGKLVISKIVRIKATPDFIFFLELRVGRFAGHWHLLKAACSAHMEAALSEIDVDEISARSQGSDRWGSQLYFLNGNNMYFLTENSSWNSHLQRFERVGARLNNTSTSFLNFLKTKRSLYVPLFIICCPFSWLWRSFWEINSAHSCCFYS